MSAQRTPNKIDEELALFRAVQTGNFEFHDALPVSAKSCFGDSHWDFRDENNPRLNASNQSSLHYDWSLITRQVQSARALRNHQQFLAVLPFEMVEDLKRAFLLMLMFPEPIRSRRGAAQRKSITIIAKIRAAVNFFSYCYLQSLLPGCNRSRLRTLSDFELSDIQKGLDSYPYSTVDLRKVLGLLTNERIQSNLQHGRLKWNYPDLKTLKWPRRKEGKSIETLPDHLFALLSNRSSDLVGEFLTLLGKEVKDSRPQVSKHSHHARTWTRFAEMFTSYCERRIDCGRNDRQAWASNHTREFVHEFNTLPEKLFEFLSDVQCAAQNIILLYTGMRYSEAAMLQVGCLKKRNGIFLMKSSLIKNVASNMPIDYDEWVAIDVVRDAVSALEELARFTLNPFLFSNFHTLKVGKKPRPLTNGGLNFRLNEYLKRVDIEKKWTGWVPTPHQYRHGLIRQLARAEVGLPYITRQLKHFHTSLSERSYRVNGVSTIYGMQKERLVGNATGLLALKGANFDIIQDLYGEGRKFAGGGAALHVRKTEAFFRGIGLEGENRKKYIVNLAASGVVPIRTGVGWCVRNHVDPKKLAEEPPPCIGDLNCNPHTCKHSVVPEGRKADVIARYRNAAKQLASPDQSHLQSHWQAEMQAYGAMLEQLGIDPTTLSTTIINPDTIAKVLSSN